MNAPARDVAVLYGTVVEALKNNEWEPREEGDGVRARCPAHGGGDRNLAVDPGQGGKAIITCHSQGCTYHDVLKALGLWNDTAPKQGGKGKRTTPRREPDYVWRYIGENGREVAQVVRWDRQHGENDPWWKEDATKIVRPRIPNGRGGYNLKAPGIWPLYGLPGLLERPTAPVLIVEGEKAASRAAAALGTVCVTTSAMGSKQAGRTDWSPLAGRDCVIWPDADEAGMRYAREVARMVPDLRCVDTSGLPDKWDLGDPLPAGFDAGTVIARLQAAKPLEPARGGQVPEGATRKGLERVLKEMGIAVRWNVRGRREQVSLPDGDGWEGLTDRIAANTVEEIADRFRVPLKGDGERPLVFGRDVWARCLNAVLRHNEVDPFLLWLDELPAWDGTARIDHLLRDLFGADEGPIAQWCSRYVAVGSIQRAYKPGAKVDEIPVLIGEQGVGKSAFATAWIPEQHREEWFGNGLDLSATKKERAELMDGRLIVEISELTGMRRADLETLKDFITTTNDGQHRSAYARHSEGYPRRCVLIGTSNDDQCLPDDPTGNRRFVPVELVRGCHVEGYFDEHRAQLWAEALARYKQGLRANMPRDLMPEAAEIAERHRGRDSIEDAVAVAIGECWQTGTSISDLAVSLQLPEPNRSMQMRLSNALKQHGWIKERTLTSGVQRTIWRPGPDALHPNVRG